MYFRKQAQDDSKPFFVGLNTSRMHLYTRLNEEWRYAAEDETTEARHYVFGVLLQDHDIGVILDLLEANGLDENNIVWYSTDDRPKHVSKPYGGTMPFRGEKMGTFEGGKKILSMLRGSGEIERMQIKNGIQTHQDMFTTLAAAAGVGDVNGQMLAEKGL